MPSLFQSGFRLGDCSVDPLRGEIVRAGVRFHVTPKAMELLLCLVENREQLVTREQLIAAGWGDAGNHEGALTRCIGELRHALDDHHETPRYIQTIPRRGYRLVAPVEVDDGDDNGAAKASEAAAAAGFWSELQRREVIRASLAYIAVAWLVIEVFSVLEDAFALPDWTIRLLVVMAIVGLPIVAVLAWALQMTGSGIVPDTPEYARPEQSAAARLRKADFFIIAVLLLAVGVLSWRELTRGPPATAVAVHENSVAVLPFRNLSGHAEDEYIGDGLAEELLNLLSQAEDLHVAAGTASFYFKNKDVELPEILKSLRVRNIVEGSVQRSGDTIRVTVQLIDGQTLMHRWSDTYDTSLDNLLEIRDRIAQQVASELETVMTARGMQNINQTPGTDGQAFLFYLQARAELRKEHDEETLQNALRHFDRALARDPAYAQAYAGKCDAYLARYVQSGRKQEYFDAAAESCNRALQLDEGLSEVHTALGTLYRESGQLEKSATELARALELEPSSYDAVYSLAQTLEEMGEIEAAEARYRRLIDMQSAYWHGYNALGHFLYRFGRYAEAIEVFRKVTQLTPDNALGFNNLGAAFYMAGNYRDASSARP